MPELRDSLPLHDKASFWGLVAAGPAVIGGISIGIALAQFSKVNARTDLWSYGWFKLGIGLEVLAVLILNWALVLPFAHRHAEKHIIAYRAAEPTVIPVPGPTGPAGPSGQTGERGPTGPTGPMEARRAPQATGEQPRHSDTASAGARRVPDFSAELRRFQEIDREYDGGDEWTQVIQQWIDSVKAKLEAWNPRNAKRFASSSMFTDVALTASAGLSGRGDLVEYPELRRLHLYRNRLLEIVGDRG